MRPDAELLKEVPLFELLDDHERADLAAQLDDVHFNAGETIFNYGDPGDAIYMICSGEVEVFFKNDTGERIVLEVATRGDFFGELSLLDNGYRSASVQALQDTDALRLDRDDLRIQGTQCLFIGCFAAGRLKGLLITLVLLLVDGDIA